MYLYSQWVYSYERCIGSMIGILAVISSRCEASHQFCELIIHFLSLSMQGFFYNVLYLRYRGARFVSHCIANSTGRNVV